MIFLTLPSPNLYPGPKINIIILSIEMALQARLVLTLSGFN